MDRQYENKIGSDDQKYKSRPLTPQEKKELCVNSIKRVKPLLYEIEKWRRESLDSKFRF